MPHISKKKLEPRVLKQILYFFKAIMADLKTDEGAAAFLNSLLTNTEKLMLAKRLAMVVLIKEGISDSKIVETLKTTHATVEKMKLMLDKTMGGYQIGLKKLEKRENWRKFKEILLKS
ncbi:unnamed protein product [marine sediment metagenome]|uniref:TrpR like protein, YerC/YecD n=1 Tax=marine sediment metagenome TaxID=412755 RepID=X0W1T1_9ZZZZ